MLIWYLSLAIKESKAWFQSIYIKGKTKEAQCAYAQFEREKINENKKIQGCPSAWEELKWVLTNQVLLEATDTNKAFLELTRSAGSSWTSCRRGRTCRSASTACIQESSGQGSKGRSPESSSGTRTRTLAPACHELDPERSCNRDWISKWLEDIFGQQEVALVRKRT